MNLHEYQAKDLLRKYNLPILEGKSYIENVDDLEKDLQNIKGPPLGYQITDTCWRKRGREIFKTI